MKIKKRYNVVFRNTKANGSSEGLITYRSFESKEAFNKQYTAKIKKLEAIVEEGVSDERAIKLCAQTPFACKIASAVKEAIGSGGNIHEGTLYTLVGNAITTENIARERLGLPVLEIRLMTIPFIIN
jgi:hypothetical protein